MEAGGLGRSRPAVWGPAVPGALHPRGCAAPGARPNPELCPPTLLWLQPLGERGWKRRPIPYPHFSTWAL